MRHLFLSKNDTKKADYVRTVRDQSTGSVIHIHPKNTEPYSVSGVFRTTYEDLNKTEVWLHVNSLAGENTTIILENPTRYPKITSPKFKLLQRLSFRCGSLVIVDIVPFTLDIKYLYGTYSYLDRGILGYSHYYAWRENYQELTESGQMSSAHDPELIALKVKGSTTIDYPSFVESPHDTIRFHENPSELAEYELRKKQLFEAESNPQRIVTRLADHAHAKASRTNAVIDLISSLGGDCSLYCNLSSYSAKLNKAIKLAGLNKRAKAYSYAKQGPPAENLIYMESPIVKSYLLLDAEARGADKTYTMLGDLKVDQYLYVQHRNEIEQINSLTKELYRVKDRVKG